MLVVPLEVSGAFEAFDRGRKAIELANEMAKLSAEGVADERFQACQAL